MNEVKAYRLTLSLVNGAKAIRQVSQEDLNCFIGHFQTSQWMQVEDTYFQISKVCSVEVEVLD